MRIPFIGEILTRNDQLKLAREKQLHHLETENSYLKARIRAINEHAFEIRRGECFINIQGKDGKFRRIQLPEVK